MLDLEEDAYETNGVGLLKQVGKYFVLTIIGVVLMALPCYVLGLIILRGG